MRMRRWFELCVLVGIVGVGSSATADVKLPAVLGSNMVLQRDAEVPFWGTADPGEKVTVTVGQQTATATADAKGRWKTTIGPLKAGGPLIVTVAAGNTVTLENVLVGEVWVCSGQSNMAWTVLRSNHATEEIAAAKYPKIRLLTVPRNVAAQLQSDFVGSWQECSPQTVPSFSAVGYFFGRALYQELGVPIGLINTSVGGTPAEAWTSRSTLERNQELKVLVDRWDQRIAAVTKEKYEQQLTQWQEAVKKAKAAGKRPPRRPRFPAAHPSRTSGLYNAMISPLIPFAFRGAIWYQGESNASRAYQYRTLFSAMIEDWRQNWGQGEFPFLFVQLANFKATAPEPQESAWAELREAQNVALKLPNTGTAVIIDIGEAQDIHPKNKQTVGLRLSLAARKIAYGGDLVFSGPTYKSMKVEGNKVRLRFDHVGGGLVAKGDSALAGFAVCGPDKRFVWAEARIEDNEVAVWCEKVAKPIAVRYAWADNPICNLYNKEGLPASPFRTDDFPGVTVNNK